MEVIWENVESTKKSTTTKLYQRELSESSPARGGESQGKTVDDFEYAELLYSEWVEKGCPDIPERLLKRMGMTLNKGEKIMSPKDMMIEQEVDLSRYFMGEGEMKLKTRFQDEDFDLGEVVEGVIVECLGKHEKELRVIATAAKGGQHTFYYSSIKKFMDDWEDAPEEPKKYWFIDAYGNIVQNEITKHYGDEYTDMADAYESQKQIGNYFETEEEANKALEKLKAFTRLKDKGFKFNGIEVFSEGLLEIDGVLSALKGADNAERLKMIDDLNTCFGGEE